MTEDAGALVDKARRSLAAAWRLHAGGDYDFAVSRGYYAMFYVAQALLVTEQVAFSRHSAVLAEFNRRYVATGRLDRRYYTAIRGAFDARNAADYESLPNLTDERARGVLEAAASFIDGVSRLLPRA